MTRAGAVIRGGRPKGQIDLTAAVVAPGLMVIAIILFMGAVSATCITSARAGGVMARPPCDDRHMVNRVRW